MRPFLRTAAFFALVLSAPSARAADIDFTRDVRPILSRHCFKCHGPDDKARKAKLRLDLRGEAVRKAIVPGKPDDSELVRRILATDDGEIMPPPATKNPLTDAQKQTLRRWIAAGGPLRPRPPRVPRPDRPVAHAGGGRRLRAG